MPPGGGLARGEEPLAAAARELAEETGCLLEQACRIEVSHEDLHGAGNCVHVVVGQARGAPVADRREVIEARFFALDDLPHNTAGRLAPELPAWVSLYRHQRKAYSEQTG